MEERHSCDYLVILFCGTLGNNDPEFLGSDESDIIIVVWQLLDLVENQVRTFLLMCFRLVRTGIYIYPWVRIGLGATCHNLVYVGYC